METEKTGRREGRQMDEPQRDVDPDRRRHTAADENVNGCLLDRACMLEDEVTAEIAGRRQKVG